MLGGGVGDPKLKTGVGAAEALRLLGKPDSPKPALGLSGEPNSEIVEPKEKLGIDVVDKLRPWVPVGFEFENWKRLPELDAGDRPKRVESADPSD